MGEQKIIPIWMVLGSICAGLIVVNGASLVMGAIGQSYLLYGLCTWFWVSSVDLLNRQLSPLVKDISLRFSMAWLLPISILLLMGMFHLTIPVFIIATCAIFDLIVRLAVSIRNNLSCLIKSFISGFLQK